MCILLSADLALAESLSATLLLRAFSHFFLAAAAVLPDEDHTFSFTTKETSILVADWLHSVLF